MTDVPEPTTGRTYELDWEPSVKCRHIGVRANNGVVTLTGYVEQLYAKSSPPKRRAGRVDGVKAVAVDLDVRYSSNEMQGDDDIAKRALQVLCWDIDVPKGKMEVQVENGWVTLTGDVDMEF